jgi:hypothetical protein
MATRSDRTPAPLRDVLYAFSLAKPIPDAELLDEFIRRYPEYAADLTDFAIELILDDASREVENEEAPVEATTVMDPAVSRAMSRFQNRLYAIQQAKLERSMTAPVQNPFAALDRSSFRSLAQRLNANTVFLAKLRDRQIDPETMTDGFRQRIADELKAPLDVICAHFAAQQQVQARPQYFKADQKPEVGGRQTFEDAVRSSGLTQDQQRYLLGL